MKLQNPQYHRYQLCEDISNEITRIEMQILKNYELMEKLEDNKHVFLNEKEFLFQLNRVEVIICELKDALKTEKIVLRRTEAQMTENLSLVAN